MSGFCSVVGAHDDVGITITFLYIGFVLVPEQRLFGFEDEFCFLRCDTDNTLGPVDSLFQ